MDKELKNNKITRIYKYCEININTISALIEGKNWISDPVSFNDPFEFSLPSDMDYCPNLKKTVYTDTEQGITNKQNIKQDLNTKIGVICYSYECDNILMWSHYAKYHTGICLGFEPNIRYNQSNEFKFEQLNKVNYSEYIPKPNFEDLSMNNIQVIFSTKSKNWNYEKEVRQIFDKKKQYIDYPGVLKDVYFGCQTSKKDIKLIKSLFINKDITFYYCEKQEGQYSLSIGTGPFYENKR